MGYVRKEEFEARLREVQRRMELQARAIGLQAAAIATQQMQALALQCAIQLEREQVQALSFLLDQHTQRVVRYQFLEEAVRSASDEYMGIVTSEAGKPLDYTLLVTFAALALIPEWAAAATALKVIDDKWKTWIGAAKALGKTIDLRRAGAGSDGHDRRGAFSAANAVVRDFLEEILQQQAAMSQIISAFTAALGTGLPRPLQFVKGFWTSHDLDELSSLEFTHAQRVSDRLSSVLLYDMLRAYTNKYVSVKIKGPQVRVKYSDVREAIPDGVVEVHGLDDAQREMIYDRFSQVPWINDRSRRPVKSWRDLVLIWGADLPDSSEERISPYGD